MDRKISVRFLVPMLPLSVNQMYRNFRGRTIKSADARKFELAFNHYLADFADQARIFLENFDEDRHVIHGLFRFYLPNFLKKSGGLNKNQQDLDNNLKQCVDQVFRFINLDDVFMTKIATEKVNADSPCSEVILQIHDRVDAARSPKFIKSDDFEIH